MKKLTLIILILLFTSLTFGQSGKSVLTQAQKDSIGAIINDSLLVNREIQRVETVSSLRGLADKTDFSIAYLKGYYADGDGGGGWFYWSPSSTATDDGGTIFKCTSITTGRWMRVMDGNIRKADWYGVKYDSSDCSTTWANMISNLPKDVRLELHPAGKYFINQSTSYYQNFVSLTNFELDGKGAQITTVPAGATNVAPNIVFTTFAQKDSSYYGKKINGLFAEDMPPGQLYAIVTDPTPFEVLNRGDLISIGDTSYNPGVEAGGGFLIFDKIADDSIYFQKPSYYPINKDYISDIRYSHNEGKNCLVNDLIITNGSILFSGFDNVIIRNVFVSNTWETLPANQPAAAIQIFWAKNILVDGYEAHNFRLKGYGYGISVSEFDIARINNGYFADCRHGITTGSSYTIFGGNELYVNNCSAFRSKDMIDLGYASSMFDSHASVYYTEFNNCTTVNQDAAYSFRAQEVKINGAKSYNDKYFLVVPEGTQKDYVGKKAYVNNSLVENVSAFAYVGAQTDLIEVNNTKVKFKLGSLNSFIYWNADFDVDTIKINDSEIKFAGKTSTSQYFVFKPASAADTSFINYFLMNNSLVSDAYYIFYTKRHAYKNLEILNNKFDNINTFLYYDMSDSTINPVDTTIVKGNIFNNTDYILSSSANAVALYNAYFTNNDIINTLYGFNMPYIKPREFLISGCNFVNSSKTVRNIYYGLTNSPDNYGSLIITKNNFTADSSNAIFIYLANGGINDAPTVTISNNYFNVRKFQTGNFLYSDNIDTKVFNNVFEVKSFGGNKYLLYYLGDNFSQIIGNTFDIGSDNTYYSYGIYSNETTDSLQIQNNNFNWHNDNAGNAAINVSQGKIILGLNHFAISKNSLPYILSPNLYYIEEYPLTVRDINGDLRVITSSFGVIGADSVADYSSEGGRVFTFGVSCDSIGSIVMKGTGLISVNWGDSIVTNYTLTTSNQTLSHVYADSGSYTVIIRYPDKITNLSMSNVHYTDYTLNSSNFNMPNLVYLYLDSLDGTQTINSSDIPNVYNLFLYNLTGTQTIDPNDMPNLSYLSLNAIGGNFSYTTHTWVDNMNLVKIIPLSGGLDACEIDAMLEDLTNSTWAYNKQVILTGTNEERTSSSNTAVATLAGLGVTVTVNGTGGTCP